MAETAFGAAEEEPASKGRSARFAAVRRPRMCHQRKGRGPLPAPPAPQRAPPSPQGCGQGNKMLGLVIRDDVCLGGKSGEWSDGGRTSIC